MNGVAGRAPIAALFPRPAAEPGPPHGADLHPVPVINLGDAPGHRETWDRPTPVIYLWALAELLLLRNPLQPSSRVRAHVLRWFGAHIGQGVILRPGLRVTFPWKLTIGDRSWLGENVWLHNQDQLRVGADVVLSQQTFVTTGTHAFRADMALTTKPVHIEDGVWVTSRCTVLGGTRIGRSAVILPTAVVRGIIPAGVLFGPPRSVVLGPRFPATPEGD